MDATAKGGGKVLKISDLRQLLGAAPANIKMAAYLAGVEPVPMYNSLIFTPEQAAAVAEWFRENDPNGLFHGPTGEGGGGTR